MENVRESIIVGFEIFAHKFEFFMFQAFDWCMGLLEVIIWPLFYVFGSILALYILGRILSCVRWFPAIFKELLVFFIALVAFVLVFTKVGSKEGIVFMNLEITFLLKCIAGLFLLKGLIYLVLSRVNSVKGKHKEFEEKALQFYERPRMVIEIGNIYSVDGDDIFGFQNSHFYYQEVLYYYLGKCYIVIEMGPTSTLYYTCDSSSHGGYCNKVLAPINFYLNLIGWSPYRCKSEPYNLRKEWCPIYSLNWRELKAFKKVKGK